MQKPVDKNLDGVMKHMQIYMSLREAAACRINKSLVGVLNDIIWMQMTNLIKVLSGYKSYGPEKYRVCDVMAGWDENRKREFFQLTGQNTIMHEISPRDDKNVKNAVADEVIHDLKTFFKAMNPGIESMVELVESWIMWDVRDATDIFNFEEQIKKLVILRNRELPPEFLRQYAGEMNKMAGEDPTQADVYVFELNRLRSLITGLIIRLREQKPYKMIVARRTEVVNNAIDMELQSVARHCRALEMIAALPDGPITDEKVRAHYGAVLALESERITKAAVTEYESAQIGEGKIRLRTMLDDTTDGEAYNYKSEQVFELKDQYDAEAELGKQKFATAGVAMPQQMPSDPNAMFTQSGVFKVT